MPSPFPGMDPFLEHPAIFPEFHDRFATTLSTMINQRLPSPYYAGLASRVWVEESNRFVQPDVHILQPTEPAPEMTFSSGQTATAVIVPVEIEPVTVQLPGEEFHEEMVEIYAEPGGERLVTHIELLSHSNKRGGSVGREAYLRKQREMLDADVHLIEIDLLRGGEHTLPVPWPVLRKKSKPHDYRIGLHRFTKRIDYVVYPIPLPARLPTIPIPLLPGDPDIEVDLQAVLAECYRTGLYERRVKYQADQLDPPLSPAYWAWAEQLIQQSRP